MKRYLILLLCMSSYALAQTSTMVDPATRIAWPRITGAGTPASLGYTCTAANYGQPFLNIATTPNINYTCGTNGWQVGSSGQTYVAQGSGISVTGSGSSSDPYVVSLASAILNSIAVTPASTMIFIGGTRQFTATGTYSNGSTANLTSTATWTGTSGVASISSAGLATGVGVGTATIAAAVGGISGSTPLYVSSATLSSITVTPSTTIIAGQTQQFDAVGHYTDGSTADLTTGATWTSGTPATATINSAGLATSLATGSTTIQAASGGVSGTAPLAVALQLFAGVAAPGATATVTASGSNVTLSTGDVLAQAHVGAETVGMTFGPYSPNNQVFALLLVGSSHTFLDNASGLTIPFNAPIPVTFTNAFGVSVTEYLYLSTYQAGPGVTTTLKIGS
jgi:hypothetical protein